MPRLRGVRVVCAAAAIVLVAGSAGPAFADTRQQVRFRPPSGVEGRVIFSPACGTEPAPPEPPCSAQPGEADIRLLLHGRVVAATRAGSDGRFRILVRPGRYDVVADGGGPPIVGCSANPARVAVLPQRVSWVDVACDSGMRF
ncbi:MAG TPA: hypothetical protein VM121_11680 [Acidimicrobiales bacterium]|nr:hypothetical protein [Acidimicrobiales bacterium]